MQTIMHNNLLYDVVDWINFSGTTHLIIQRGNDFEFINYEDGHYYKPTQFLEQAFKQGQLVSFNRKQYILRYFIQFMDAREIDNIDDARSLVNEFKKYIKSSNVERFIYWPILEPDDFSDELTTILSDMEYVLELELHKQSLDDSNDKSVINFNDDSVFIKNN